MTVYIENFLIQNILINLCLLRLISLSIRMRSSLLRYIISSVFGAGFSLLASILLNNNIAINIIKILCAIAMLIIAFKASIKQYALSFILLFVFTYTFGGLVMNFATVSHTTNYGIVYSSKFSLEAICAIIIAGTYIYEKVVKMLKFKLKTNDLIYKITLYSNDKKLTLNAYLDTGNFLNIQGRPILIADIDTYQRLTNKNIIDFYLDKSDSISTATVTGESNLKLIKVDKLELYLGRETRTFDNQYIAINGAHIFKDTDYQALLTPLFL